MKNLINFIIIILIFSSCVKKKFDKELWNSDFIDDKITYENRHEMLDDLLENYKLKGKKISDIENIMGKFNEHDYSDSTNLIVLPVLVKWKGIAPYKYKYLNLRYNNKDIVDSVYITEYSIE